MSVSASPSATDDEWDFDRESVIDEENALEGPLPDAVEYDPHAVVGNLQWDEDLTPGPSAPADTPTTSRPPATIQLPWRRPTQTTITPILSAPREDTPLLRKTTSLSFAEPPRPASDGGVLPTITVPADRPSQVLTRRESQLSTRSVGISYRRGSNASRVTKAVQTGQSTYGQTVCRG